MAAEDKNTRLKSNMTIAILPGHRPASVGLVPVAVLFALEGDVDIYTIIFAALAVFIFLRLRSVLGQRIGSEPPFRVSALVYRLSTIAFVLGAVNYVAYEAKWYEAIAARVTPISGPARVVDGNTVVVLLAMALCAAAALVLSFLHWKEWNAQRINPGLLHPKAQRVDPGPLHPKAQRVDPGFEREEWKAQKPGQGDGLKKAKPLDGLLRDHPSQRKADDPRIEREFNNVFMTLSKERKQALIKRWMDRKKCDREEAMRLAIEELRRDNR